MSFLTYIVQPKFYLSIPNLK